MRVVEAGGNVMRLDRTLSPAVQLWYVTRTRRSKVQGSSRETGVRRQKAGLAALRVVPLVLMILLAVSYLIAIPVGFIGSTSDSGRLRLYLLRFCF